MSEKTLDLAISPLNENGQAVLELSSFKFGSGTLYSMRQVTSPLNENGQAVLELSSFKFGSGTLYSMRSGNQSLKRERSSKQEDFHRRVTVDQDEGLCHRITLHFGKLNIETGALYYCI